MSGQAALRVLGLVARPGGAAGGFELRVPDLSLVSGETLAIVGPNGAGKSTLMRALASLQPLTAGRLEGLSRASRALVFQRPLLLSGSVEHNVRLALWGRGLDSAEVRRRVHSELQRFGIAGLSKRSASTLSGGEARRLALARAFAVKPKVLLLDEPFDDLDAAGQEALSLDVERAIRETGVAVAMVAHELSRALLLADRLAVLVGGRVLQVGARDEVLRRPVDAQVASLVGMTNLVPGTVEARLGDGVRVRVGADHTLVARVVKGPGSRVLVGIRPEHLKLDVGRGQGACIGKGVVRHVLSDGQLVRVTVEWAGWALRTHLLAGRGLGEALRAGDPVSLRVRPEDVHLMNPQESAR